MMLKHVFSSLLEDDMKSGIVFFTFPSGERKISIPENEEILAGIIIHLPNAETETRLKPSLSLINRRHAYKSSPHEKYCLEICLTMINDGM